MSSVTPVAPHLPGEIATVDAVLEPGLPTQPKRKRRLRLGLWFSVVWVSFVTLAAIFAPILPGLKDPVNDADFLNTDVGWFHAGHLFGTDDLGRDVFSRVIWGGRASLMVSVGSVLVGVLIGGLLGLIAGYRGGRVDATFSAGFNILLAFPQLVLALVLVAVLSPNTDAHPSTFSSRI